MRILIITNRIPYPPISGAPLRTYQLLRRIAKENEVWLAAFCAAHGQDEGVLHMREFCKGVEIARPQRLGALSRPIDAFHYMVKRRPLDLRLYHSEELADRIVSLAAKVDFDLIQIEHSYMALYLESLPREIKSKTVLMLHDIVFGKFNRIYQIEPSPARKLRLWLHSCMMRLWEPRYAQRFDLCVTVSEVDQQLLLAANPKLKVDVVPNGVDTQVYQQLPHEDNPPAILFLGNMDYQPNIDAILWFCNHIFPSVRCQVPELEMWIVGINPRPEVRRLNGNGVHVTGRVDDICPYYGRSTVCVVPLRAGGGTRLKILEAMAFGRPVVSTTIGCEGLDVVDSEHLLVADDPEEFAEKTLFLLTNEAARHRIANQARELVVDHYDWDVIARRLLEIYAELIE